MRERMQCKRCGGKQYHNVYAGVDCECEVCHTMRQYPANMKPSVYKRGTCLDNTSPVAEEARGDMRARWSCGEGVMSIARDYHRHYHTVTRHTTR